MKFTDDIRRELAFLQYAPILYASALTKQRVNRLADLVKYVSEQQNMTWPAFAAAKGASSSARHRAVPVPIALLTTAGQWYWPLAMKETA